MSTVWKSTKSMDTEPEQKHKCQNVSTEWKNLSNQWFPETKRSVKTWVQCASYLYIYTAMGRQKSQVNAARGAWRHQPRVWPKLYTASCLWQAFEPPASLALGHSGRRSAAAKVGGKWAPSLMLYPGHRREVIRHKRRAFSHCDIWLILQLSR